jgi:8-oxo-dGTP diphosphatase
MFRHIVAVALVDLHNNVLVQRRPAHKEMGGLWEFPGGKVEEGETPEAALVRELAEELGLLLDEADLEPNGFASAPVGGRHMILMLYICRRWQGEPVLMDADAMQWVSIEEMKQLAMPPADGPLIPLLASAL